MLTPDQHWQQILDAKRAADELEVAYKASVEDAHRGQPFDKGVLNRLTAAKVKLARLQAEWGRRNARR